VKEWLNTSHVKCRQKCSYSDEQRATVVHYFKSSQILFRRSVALFSEFSSVCKVYARSVLDSVTCFIKEDASTYQAPLAEKLFAEKRKVAETAAEASETVIKINRMKKM